MARVVHFEIHADNPERAMAFYAKTFGWSFQHLPALEYWIIAGEGQGIDGGLLRRRGPRPADGQAVNAFVCTIGVADVDRTVRTATDAGARIAAAKAAIPGVGYVAYLHDPEGNIFGVFQQDANAA